MKKTQKQEDPILGFYRGKAKIVGDILSPVHTEEEYEEFFERSAAQLSGQDETLQ